MSSTKQEIDMEQEMDMVEEYVPEVEEEDIVSKSHTKATKKMRKKITKPRKKHRARNGMKALREIRKLQKYSGGAKERVIPKKPVYDLIREIIDEVAYNEGTRVKGEAFDALYGETVEYMTDLFRDAQEIACSVGGTIELMPKHFLCAAKMHDERAKIARNMLK